MLINKISSTIRDYSKQLNDKRLEADSRYAPQGVGRSGLPRHQDIGVSPKSVEEDLEAYDGIFMQKERIPLYAKIVKYISDPEVKRMLVSMVSGKSNVGITYLSALTTPNHTPGVEGYEAIVRSAYKKDSESKVSPEKKSLEKVVTPEGSRIRKDTQEIYNKLINKVRSTDEENKLVDVLNSPNNAIIQEFHMIVKKNQDKVRTHEGLSALFDMFENSLTAKGQQSPIVKCASYLKDLSVKIKEAGYDKLSYRLASTSFKLLIK